VSPDSATAASVASPDIAKGDANGNRLPIRTPPQGVSPAPPIQETAKASGIVVQTVRPVWMRLDVDGAGDTGRLYSAGETMTVNPRQTLVIRAGDAGAVMLAVNGGPMAALGPAGQVLTRRISTASDAATSSRVDQKPADAPVAPSLTAPRPATSGGNVE